MFSVFGRKLPSKKTVYYYQCYDEKGKRQWAKSTGLTKKTEAMAYCMKLFKDGLLIPEQKTPLFSEFSKGWWDIDTCRYLKWRQLHDPIQPGTLSTLKSNFENHIKDYFAKYRLDEITPNVIEGWLLDLSGKGFKPNTINTQYRTLRLMMNEAERQKLIKNNPCDEVKKVNVEEEERKILTVEEARKLFTADWVAVWDTKVSYLANKLAACTGLRIGELRGLRREHIFDDYIFVTGQYTNNGYVAHTKTKHNRNVPITPLMRRELEELLEANGNGYIFSDEGGEKPMTVNRLHKQYEHALEKIGITNGERRKRKLTFHAWRHFLNTLLRMSNIADSKVQSVTGHKTMRMTDHYTHFDTREFTEIRDVQAELLAFKKPEKEKAAQRKSSPVKKTAAKKKRQPDNPIKKQ
jgi:integrase